MQRRKRYVRPGYKACATMVVGDAKKALAVARQVKGMLNTERNFLDRQLTNSAVSTTGQLFSVILMAQGDTSNLRQGDQVKLVHIRYDATYKIHASATQSNLRIIIFVDKQANGALPTVANLLTDVTASDGIVSGYNPDNKYRFRVLYDKVVQLDQAGKQSGRRSFRKKLNLRIRYGTNAGDITDLNSTNLLFLILSDEATNTPTTTQFIRTLFVDN